MKYNLVISGEIGGWWNGCSADYVRYVLNCNKDKDVHVGFCSLGGYVKDGLELHQAFRDHGRVYAHAFGMNASISTIAMLGAKSIDIVKGSFFLIHNVSVTLSKWAQTNKEQMDEYIAELQKTRADLKTFDEVLASMYSEKNGKPIADNLAQMRRGNWLSAQQALDFGLVDAIRDDAETETEARNYIQNFINSYNIKDSGIPPLPTDDDSRLSSIVDDSGNPTQSFLQKTWQGFQSLFRNQHADNPSTNNKNMKITVFNSLMALLAFKDGFEPDGQGNISLTQAQMKQVDDRLADLERKDRENAEAIKASAAAVVKLKDKVTALEADVTAKNQQIANLKQGPGASSDRKPDDGNGGGDIANARDLYNLIKDID